MRLKSFVSDFALTELKKPPNSGGFFSLPKTFVMFSNQPIFGDERSLVQVSMRGDQAVEDITRPIHAASFFDDGFEGIIRY